MRVRTLNEEMISEIGRAFGDYDYGSERSLADAFPSRDAAAAYICGYVRMALQSGMLYTTSESREGFIAFRRPGEKVSLRAGLCFARSTLGAMRLRDWIRFAKIMAQGGESLSRKMDRKKAPYLFVGLVCVREPYQGKGYMRRVMEMAYAEGDRLGVPVILDTDAKSKCDKYEHLGMTLANTRRFGGDGVLYDLVREPKKSGAAERKND